MVINFLCTFYLIFSATVTNSMGMYYPNMVLFGLLFCMLNRYDDTVKVV